MIHRKNNMNQEEYGYFIYIENNTNNLCNYFPDNLKSMSEKYKIRSINKNYCEFNKLNKFNINFNVNIMNTIPEIDENIYRSHKKIQYNYNKIAIYILLLFILSAITSFITLCK